ncbi:putative spermidine/putrescine transport system permease protein [Desulfitobacterium sp. LBE]|uniref:ABC transporter permease n=1 Tax=Desulfitobacterium sp. LBE TaxID=884086 RepID=UPI0011998074|nr:ABC transporter permease subunit [Desulfitobacterium sp. LBE]TWH55966.1 putative spermidine/putrescine transport system permease protein [Desulfitobacterium sp. LBE]
MAEQKKGYSSLPVIWLFSLYLLLPLLLTFLYSVFTQWTNLVPQGFTLRYYGELFTDSGFLLSLLRTVVISILPVLLCIGAVLMAMYVVVIYHPEWGKYVEIICTIPYALQGIILAISVLSLYSGLPLPFSNRILMITGTYCVLVLPFIYRGIRNSLNAVNALQLIEAAQLLGAGRLQAYLKIVVPNILSGITVAAMLGMSILFGDFVVINVIGGSYYETAQMHLYKILFRSGQLSSALIVVLFVVTLLISGSVFLRKRKGAE